MNCVKCGREVYDGGDTCIFHCEKNGWGKYKISLFWSNLKEAKVNGDYSNFIFPEHRIKNNNGFFDKAVTFKNVTFLGEVNFSDSNIKNIDFSNTVFLKNIICKNTKFDGNINFSSIDVSGDIFFHKTIFKNKAKYLKCNFRNKVTFSQCTFEQGITFKNSIFKKKTEFLKINSEKSMEFKNTTFEYKLFINSYGKEKKQKKNNFKIDFYKAKIYDLMLINLKNTYLDFSNTTIDGYLSISERDESNIDNKHVIISTLKLNKTHFKRDSKIRFKNLSIDNFILDGYTNHSQNIRFRNLILRKNVLLKDIDFKYEKFLNIDFSLVKKIEFRYINFSKNIFEDIQWGNLEHKRFNGSEKNYRELKDFSEEKRNFKNSDGFYILELKKRKENLYNKLKESNIFNKIKLFFNDILILEINEKTSNYTQNWLLPFFWILTLGMLIIITNTFQNYFKSDVEIVYIKILLAYLIIDIIDTLNKLKIHMLWLLFPLILFINIAFFNGDITHYLDKLVEYINPFKILKPIVMNGSIKTIDFQHFIYGLVILFLGYQLLMSIRKKVRYK